MSFRPLAHRRVAPRCRGGASSLLRLSASAAARWPSAQALTTWADRMVDADDTAPAPMVAPAAGAASPWFTRLWPTGA